MWFVVDVKRFLCLSFFLSLSRNEISGALLVWALVWLGGLVKKKR